MRLSKIALSGLLSLLAGSCTPQPSLALIDANLPSASGRARVLFTTYTATYANNQAVVTFSDGAGNVMTFQLKGASGGLAQQTYDIDGSQNSFEAQLVITSNLENQTFTVSGTGGYVNVTSANVNGSTLTGFAGDFLVNFNDGGAGQGTFNTND